MKKGIFPASLFLLIFASASTFYNPLFLNDSKTLVLYDAASGDIPSNSLLGFADFPTGVAVPTFSDGAAILDSTVAGTDSFAGWVASGSTTTGFPVLDQTAGVQVNFTVQVESESHINNDRSGFSVTILDNDAKGIELSFWENEIYAKSDDATGGLFKHGEGVAFATNTLTAYQVTFVSDTYTLTANAQTILSGPLRDYSAFAGFPDPYETPNFLFFGDNTTSAQARIRLLFVSVTGTEPVVPTSTSVISSPTAPSQPSATPIPTSIPTRPVSDLCPSGGLLGVVATIGILMKRIKVRFE